MEPATKPETQSQAWEAAARAQSHCTNKEGYITAPRRSEGGCLPCLFLFQGRHQQFTAYSVAADQGMTQRHKQVPKSKAPRPGGQLRAWPQAPRGGVPPGRSRRLQAATVGPERAGRASPAPPPTEDVGGRGRGRDRLSVSPSGTIKFPSLKEEEKNPRPLGRPRVVACSLGGARVALRSRRRGGRGGRAGMGVTVEVHQVYKYPFEQVVASFLRKVPARLWSGAPVLPRLLRPPAVCAPAARFCRCPSPSRLRVPISPGLSASLLSSLSPLSPLVPPPLPTRESAPTSPPQLRSASWLCRARVEVSSKAPPSGRGKAPCAASRSLCCSCGERLRGELQETHVLGPHGCCL